MRTSEAWFVAPRSSYFERTESQTVFLSFLFYFNFFSLVQTEFNRRKMQISFCPFIMTAVCVCLLWPFLDADLTVNFFKFFVRRCDSNKWNNKFQLVCSLKGTSAFCVCLIVNTVHVYIGIFKANTVWEFFSLSLFCWEVFLSRISLALYIVWFVAPVLFN